MSKKGFTLVELIVVVSILCLLVVVGLFYTLRFVQDARDAKRLSDLNFISKLLSLYYSDHGYYPPSDTIGQLSSGCAITPKADSQCQSLADEMKPYSSKLPYDPQDSGVIPLPNCDSSPCYYYKTLDPAHASSCTCTNLEGTKNRRKPQACSSMNFNYCIMTVL